MKHEFKQGYEVEYKTSQPEKWEKATYIGFHAGKHIISRDGSIYVIDEETRIRPIKKRWRAEIDGAYYFLSYLLIAERTKEEYLKADDEIWRVGNYFKTKEQAEQAAELIKQTLKIFHDDNQADG